MRTASLLSINYIATLSTMVWSVPISTARSFLNSSDSVVSAVGIEPTT